MWPLLLIAGAVAGGSYLARRSSGNGSPPPQAAPTINRVPLGVQSRLPVKAELKVTPPAGRPTTNQPIPEQKPSGLGIKLPGELGQIAGAIPAAAKVLDVFGSGVQQLTGSEAAGNFSRLLPVVGGLGFAGQQAGQELGKLFGADENTQNVIGRTTGLAIAGGPAALAVPLGEGISAAVGAIGGEQAEKDLRNTVAQFDPTSSTSTAGKALNTAVNSVFSLAKGIFG